MDLRGYLHSKGNNCTGKSLGLFSNSWNFTLNAAYLDIKEIYGILRNKKIYSEYFKSLKPERALDGLNPMLFFYLY